MKSGLLLSGKPITTSNGISIHPLTLGKIIELGMDNYSYYISILQMKKEIMKTIFNTDEEVDLERLKGLIALITSNPEIGHRLLYFLSIIVNERVVLEDNNIFIVDEEEKNIRVIDEDVYLEISDILDLQNCSKTVEEIEEYEDDPEIRAFIERKNELNRKIAESNSKEDPFTLDDLISSLSVANIGLNILNIWDLTLYQLYNMLSRYSAKTNADMAIKSMLAGATDVELKNWMGKINRD